MNLISNGCLESPDKKYLFLDIDDVLVTTRQHFSKKLHPKYQTHHFDKKCVIVVNQIIKKIAPTIIISSDWKLHYSLEVLNEIFHDNGIDYPITDITPDLWGIDFFRMDELEICRAHEIMKYVNEHNIKNYVAVDDLNMFQWLPNNFVHCTRSNEGIKQSGVKEKIINILLNKL